MVAPVNPVVFNGDGTLEGSLNWHKRVEPKVGYAADFMTTPGQKVFAVVDGVVSPFIDGGLGPYGMYISDGTNKFWYGHMASANVSPGQTVKAGDIIGVAGHTGAANGVDHLHFAVTEMSGMSAGEHDLTISPDQTNTFKFLSGSQYVKVTGQMGLPVLGSTASVSIVHNNSQPVDVISIVPEKIAFVYDKNQKPDPNHWELTWPTHDYNFGGVHGSADVPKDGLVNKVLFLNHAGNTIAEQIIDLELKKGDLINFDYTYTIQKYLGDSHLTDNDQAAAILHYMTEHTLDWKDGHTAAKFDSKTYDKNTEGTGNGDNGTNSLKALFGPNGLSSDFTRR